MEPRILDFEQVREGITYRNVVGVDPVTRKTKLYLETIEPDPEYGQRIRWPFRWLKAEADPRTDEGDVYKITTAWGEALLGNTGKPLPGTKPESEMVTSTYDVGFFAMAFGMGILGSALNGKYRADEGAGGMGFNAMPALDVATMKPRVWNEWQEQQPPTNDYFTNPMPVMPTEAPPVMPEPEFIPLDPLTEYEDDTTTTGS